MSRTDLGVHLQALVDAAPRVILVIDAKGEILWVTRASETLIGRRPEQLINHNVLEFVIEDDQPLMYESMACVLDEPGHFRPLEFRYRRADDSIGVLEAVSANRLDDEAIRGIVVLIHDVTPPPDLRSDARIDCRRRAARRHPAAHRPSRRRAVRRFEGGRRCRPGRRSRFGDTVGPSDRNRYHRHRSRSDIAPSVVGRRIARAGLCGLLGLPDWL